MPTLLEFQRAFAQRLCAAPQFGAPPQTTPLRRHADAVLLGFEVHRRHRYRSLSDTLAARYRVVRMLVGQGYFNVVAALHVAMSPPSEPRLDCYGDGFAETLEAAAVDERSAYLADVARLEAAIHRAHLQERWNARPAAGCRGRMALNPSLQLMVSRWNVHEIWQAHMEAGEDVGAFELHEGPCRLAVFAHRGVVLLSALDEPAWLYVNALHRQAGRMAALSMALAVCPDFAEAAERQALRDAGLLVDLQGDNDA
jgi:uncharacterized protein